MSTNTRILFLFLFAAIFGLGVFSAGHSRVIENYLRGESSSDASTAQSSSNEQGESTFSLESSSTDSTMLAVTSASSSFASSTARGAVAAPSRITTGKKGKTSAMVYDDRLGTNWRDASWGGETTDVKNGVYSGTASVKKVYEKPWEGLYLKTDSFDTTPFNTISLAVKEDLPLNADLYLSLYAGDKVTATVPLRKYVSLNQIIPNNWYRIDVPLADLDASARKITGVEIESSTSGAGYFDSMQFLMKTMLVSQPGTKASVSTSTASTVVTKPTTGQSVYLGLEGNFASGWKTADSQVTIDPKSPRPDGNASRLRIMFPDAWTGLYLKNVSGIDVSDYEGIGGYVQGAQGAENVYITLYDTSGKKFGSQRISDFIPSKAILSDKVVQFFIPLRQLKAEHKIIGGIGIESDARATIYVNQLEFSNIPASWSYTNVTSILTPQIYDGVPESGWQISSWGSVVSKTNDAYTGGSALSVQFTSPGGGLYFTNALGLRPGIFHNLSFAFKSPSGASHIALTMKDNKGALLGMIYLDRYVDTKRFGSYQIVRVPLDDLNAETSYVSDVSFSDPQGTSAISVDRITFTP